MGDIITRKEKFSEGWKGGGTETPCGSGSKIANTLNQRIWLAEIALKYNIESVTDVGAGDLNWVGLVDWDVVYLALDLIPRRPGVIQFDLVHEVPPKSDCLLCLWVLNHMPYEDSQASIRNLKASGSKYLIMTDRPVWHHEQPPEIHMNHIEELNLTAKGDRMLLIEL